jgi:hypothetical protein
VCGISGLFKFTSKGDKTIAPFFLRKFRTCMKKFSEHTLVIKQKCGGRYTIGYQLVPSESLSSTSINVLSSG